MSHLWQQPYVNVFKHFNLQSWKKSSKEGDVTSIMDKTVKGSVWRISGSIPAGNYIQLPNTSTQSLGLTGRYLYLLFRPVPSKYFVVHVDVATQDGLIVRISFSNLFKEFKSTSTWLQFPFICHAAKGTVTGRTRTRSTDNSGPAPLTTHWTVLCLDLHYILSMYINRRYSYCKSIKLCSSMFVKNIFTADTQFEPGITFEEVKRTGVTALGMAPIPREMAFPLGKCQDWHDNYDYIVFPSDTTKKPFDSIQRCDPSKIKAGPPGVVTSPKRVVSKTVHVSKTVIPEKSCIISAATNKPKRKLLHRLHTTFNMEAAPGLPAGEDEFMESPQMTRAAKQRAYMRKKKARLGSNACKLLMLQQRRATKMAAQDKYTGEERERRRIHKAQRDRRAYVNKLFKEGKPLPAPEKYSSYWQVRLGVPAAGSPQDADVKLTLPTHTAAKTDGAVMGDPPESFQNLLHILNTTNTFNRDVAPGLLAGEDEFLERSQMTKADKQWAYRRKQKELLGDKPYQVLMAQKRRAAKMAAQAKFSGIELERRRKQKAKRDRRAYVNRLFKAPTKHHLVMKELPRVGVDENGDVSIEQTSDGEIHVYAHPDEDVIIHQEEKASGKITTSRVRAPTILPAKKPLYKSLKPDPILSLKRIVGFGGATVRDVLWTTNGTTLVYPCHAVVVAMQANNGQQRFFIGHTDKVSCISLNGSSSLLASGQTGAQSVVRVWRFQSAECLAMFKTHTHSLHCLSFSNSGSVLCGVGRDSHGKNMVVIWNTDHVVKGGEVSVMAKAHTDVDIVRMRIAAFDDTRMVSCGRDNMRLWRMKDGSLRSAPINLGEHHLMEFTDCTFEAGYDPSRDPTDRIVYAASRSGHIFEIDYRKVAVKNVRRLLPVDPKTKKDKQTFNSGSGLAINTLCVNEAFCVTGSVDGYMRLWPLDFKHVYLEAEHEGPVTGVQISSDGVKILAATSSGNLGVLDISTRAYTTVMRSHIQHINSMAFDPLRRHLVTVSDDHTIRIWDLDNMQQLYDFSAPKEVPCAIDFHPTQQVFACGFESGSIRVFNISNTSMLAEHRQHRGKVVGIAFSPNGDHLYSAGSLGSIALYDATDSNYHLLRLLGNTVARGDHHGPTALAVSPDGNNVAFVGPTEFTVSVVNGKTLDEVLRIDITSLNTADNSRMVIDTAVRVHYTPVNVRHLLVTTSSNKLLKFDARTGKILAEIDNIHRSSCTAIDVSGDGRHMFSAGDKVIKVWDYCMKLDLNFQVFIGHAEVISRVLLTPDSLSVITVGEAIFIWDFLAHARAPPPLEGRTTAKNYYTGKEEELDLYRPMGDLSLGRSGTNCVPSSANSTPGRSTDGRSSDQPRHAPPCPMTYEPGSQIENLSFIEKSSYAGALMGDEVQSVQSDNQEVLIGPEFVTIGEPTHENKDVDSDNGQDREPLKMAGKGLLGNGPRVEVHHRQTTPTKHTVNGGPQRGTETVRSRPNVHRHFIQRHKKYPLAQRRYTAPPNQAGLTLESVIGYNGNGRGNMVWNPDMGVFAFTNGCIVIVEDLNEGTQQHLLGHAEEISVLALQHDCQILASASGAFNLSPSQICLWDLDKMTCKTVLTHHEYDVVCLAYSRDDRFLFSVGDYRECSIVVWSTHTTQVVVATRTDLPIFDIKWDPTTVNEFTSVGENGTILFWLLDETGTEVALNVHEAEVPGELLQTHHMGSGQVDFTCLEYAGDSTLYVGANNGTVSAWDTRQNTCFMHWEADKHEIDVLVSKGGRLVTGSTGRGLRMWSVVGVGELRLPGDTNTMRQGGLTMEDEMNLDGPITVAAFDDTMDMGIVGTSSGTLWYLNWAERTSIRLVSGHNDKVNDLALCDDRFLASCSDDGSLRIWSVKDREQTLQFQVQDQACTCLSFSPTWPSHTTTHTTVSNTSTTPVMAHSARDDGVRLPNIAGGYSDGTVRMFDLNKVEMVLKMHPHAVAVTAISFSADGRMILSGGNDGLVAVSSPTTGMTVRVISDHQGAPINCIDITMAEDVDMGVPAPLLWLVGSADRRVSIWSADWSKDTCELVDWLTFPAPAFTPDGEVLNQDDPSYYQRVPPSLVQFSSEDLDVIVYTGYGMQKQVQFYSLTHRKVVRSMALTHWATCMHMSPTAPVLTVATNERVLKLMDYNEGSFQDFVGHSDSLQLCRFSPDGGKLFSASQSEILIWDVLV